ncbi:MAG: hydantoinase/oxoprolinase family protein [Syntrophales bacterium]
MILGIDVGGTHTDAVLMDRFAIKKKAKVRTNEQNLLASLLDVTNEIVDAETVSQLERVVLSTTISTNAIVQKKVDRVGLMVVSGPGLPPSLLGAPEDTHFLTGYLNHRGIQVEAVDTQEASRLGAHFQAVGIEHVGIIGKFSPRNPQQEIALKEAIAPQSHHISLGHRMSGHLNFPRRIATTYLNEAVWERYHHFVSEVLRFVRERRIDVPIYILKADGGTFDIEQSVEFPVQTILSGPAASVMGILTMTGCSEDAIALDIGGTTTDIAIFADGLPLLEAFGVTIEGHKTLIRGLRTKSIGIGGDSTVRFQGGELSIGPEREGPAAAFGGPFPTPTDAMIVLGLTSIGHRDRAAVSLLPIADAMHLSVREAAGAIFRETCGKIATHVRSIVDEINDQPVYTIHELLEGKNLCPRVLYVVGGPAVPMAGELGRLLACEPRIPAHAEVANAIGAALARTTAEMTILADTERKIMTVAEEGFQTAIPPDFASEDVICFGREKLREKARIMGAQEADLEIEVVEVQVFNMVRDYSTTGKNIRVKVQIKPGTIAGFKRGDTIC